MTFGYEFFIVFVMFLNIDQYREVSIQFVLPFLLIVVIDIICNIITIAYECFFGQKPSDIELKAQDNYKLFTQWEPDSNLLTLFPSGNLQLAFNMLIAILQKERKRGQKQINRRNTQIKVTNIIAMLLGFVNIIPKGRLGQMNIKIEQNHNNFMINLLISRESENIEVSPKVGPATPILEK
ncbi:hypothetical protein ACJX0J_015568, partial [Zea mays]